MSDILWSLMSFVVALGLLVTVHEFGHFWVARKNGILVKKFSIGFGKTLFSWRDRQGTEFIIAAIPLGGYVRMLDERIDPVLPQFADLAFNNKTVPQRMAVIAAGPIANFIFAIFSKDTANAAAIGVSLMQLFILLFSLPGAYFFTKIPKKTN